MTSEHELRRLLKSNERPRELSKAEELRLRQRLGLEAEAEAEVEADVDLTRQVVPVRRADQNLWRRVVLLSAAAVLVIMGVVSLTRRDGSSLDASRPGGAPPPLALFCAGELDRTMDAIEAWNGVDTWAWATLETDPDVGALALEALVELERIEEPSSTAGVEVENRLEAELATKTRPAGGGPAYLARSEAAHDALRYIRDRIEELDTEGLCDLERLNAAIELGN